MAARIEARAHKVKRDSGSARGSGRPPRRRVVADFAFDLNHINDAFGSEMVKEWFFRYVRRNARTEWCGWFQGTYL
jgi:hypothetical protein